MEIWSLKTLEPGIFGAWNWEFENSGAWKHLEVFFAADGFGGFVLNSLREMVKLPKLKIWSLETLEPTNFGAWKLELGNLEFENFGA